MNWLSTPKIYFNIQNTERNLEKTILTYGIEEIEKGIYWAKTTLFRNVPEDFKTFLETYGTNKIKFISKTKDRAARDIAKTITNIYNKEYIKKKTPIESLKNVLIATYNHFENKTIEARISSI